MEELLLKLEGMNDEQKEYMLFLTLYMMNDLEKMSKTYEQLGEKFGVREENTFKTYLLASVCRDYNERSKFITEIEQLKLADQYYREILAKAKKLSFELKLDNSLQLANLFTYLLWNGYFSSDNSLRFQSNNRMLIDNHYAFDIMNGIGVCLNFSDMMSEFINQFDYSSATVMNTIDTKIKTDYKPIIKRESSKTNIRQKLLSRILAPVGSMVGNHAFNLINENGKFYIYDATNLMMFSIEDKFNCLNICGTGSAKIKPYFSHILNDSEKSFNTLVYLNMQTDFVSPYTRRDFIFTWEDCYENFEVNKSLLNYFYDEIRCNIDTINDSTKDIKRLIKERENKYRNIRNK